MKASILFLVLANSLFLLLLNSCSHIALEDSAASVDVYYSFFNKSYCDYVGDVVGSDGNLMTFMFITNLNLTRGALNDIKNKAKAMGGDSIFIMRSPLGYSTSTTFIGSVYTCK